MPIFDRSVPSRHLLPPDDAARRALVERVLALFRRRYPDIRFDVLWDSATCNAQAWRDGDGRSRVRLYGGLARHKAVGREALVYALGHEVGHHRGDAPVHPRFPWLSCECVAERQAQAAVSRLSRTPRRSLAAAQAQLAAARGAGSAGRAASRFCPHGGPHL
jgi:hypothetical protein